MKHKEIKTKYLVTMVLAPIALMGVLLSGCNTTENNTPTNSSSAPNTPAASNVNASSTSSAPEVTTSLEAREPERYSVTTRLTIQPTGNAPQANVPALQFTFARLAADRRISFKLPDPLGEVVYLEKAPLKYLIFPARNQYVELDPAELGFQLGNVMSPVSAIERLKERTQFERIGTETVNGRTAIKYRFRGAADTQTQVGTVQADSIIYVDQETGLPLRSEVDTMSSSGAGARVLTEADNLVLTPDPSLFEVPVAMKKVTSTELKQQVQGFVNAIRVFASYARQQVNTAPQAGSPPSP
jgi:hypothetical protein